MRRNRKFNNKAQAIAILFGIGSIIAVLKYLIENPILLIPIIAIPAIVIIMILVVRSQIKEEPETNNQPKNTVNSTPKKKDYQVKAYMTKTERAFGNAIYKELPTGYKLIPQVCLASIIHKNYNNKYINELFKIVDFAVFNENYYPVVLIEVNDDTHKTGERIKRDKKVKELCEEAEIPIITLWTEYGINEEYIKKRLQEYCK